MPTTHLETVRMLDYFARIMRAINAIEFEMIDEGASVVDGFMFASMVNAGGAYLATSRRDRAAELLATEGDACTVDDIRDMAARLVVVSIAIVRPGQGEGRAG